MQDEVAPLTVLLGNSLGTWVSRLTTLVTYSLSLSAIVIVKAEEIIRYLNHANAHNVC